jgi:hypothetical protein
MRIENRATRTTTGGNSVEPMGPDTPRTGALGANTTPLDADNPVIQNHGPPVSLYFSLFVRLAWRAVNDDPYKCCCMRISLHGIPALLASAVGRIIMKPSSQCIYLNSNALASMLAQNPKSTIMASRLHNDPLIRIQRHVYQSSLTWCYGPQLQPQCIGAKKNQLFQLGG